MNDRAFALTLLASFLKRCRSTCWALGVLLGCLLCRAAPAGPLEVPPWLPQYDLDIQLAVCDHVAHVTQRVTWTNYHNCATREMVFNAHSHFSIPDDQIGFLAKMAEIMRIMPREALSLGGPALEVERVTWMERAEPAVQQTHGVQSVGLSDERLPPPRRSDDQLPAPRPLPLRAQPLPFHYDHDNNTALMIPLPRAVQPGETVMVELVYSIHLPQKEGRWGQWKGVTFLSNWMPVLAYFDEKGWHPTPFIPWHQPWFNEAGVYHARLTLPCDHKVACTGTIVATRNLGDGNQELSIFCHAVRDFAIIASPRFQEYTDECGPVTIKVLAFPEHEYYAKAILRIVSEAIPVYSAWFGPFPYPQFTVVESYFGWLGNECGDLVMIDERVFAMPHLAENYVDYLVSHETCHQWWYNTIGTNGYCETFMDEAPAVYFSHRLMDEKHGKNNPLLTYPRCLEWLPSIKRENYRYYGLYGTMGRGEYGPTCQDMPKFGHVVNLFSMCYDKGSKIIGMIADRLGEAAFFDFVHIIYHKYYFRILRVADLQKELEAYTGQSWEKFFQEWLYGGGLTDWSIEKVNIESLEGTDLPVLSWFKRKGACRATVLLHQKAQYDDPTVLGFRLDKGDGYQIRVPIEPQMDEMDLDDPPTHIHTLPDHRVRVTIDLPCEPTQITVDPDQVLVDSNPCNNFWKPRLQCRLTPCYTFLDETDLTNDYDHWNFVAGPWLYFAPWNDPWFTRSTMFGLRAGAYRTQFFSGGVYTAYRYDYRDVVVGVDALFDHFPWAHTQVGLIVEHRVADAWSGDPNANRGVLFGRYVFDYGDSLYLPPMHYLETFVSLQDNFLPLPSTPEPGGQRFTAQQYAGIHYHINYLTPYWDAEGGFQFDATYSGGEANLTNGNSDYHSIFAQLSYVKSLPDGLGWLSDTRVAVRAYGAAAMPGRGEFFAMGGPRGFRGFDLSERQGSSVWVGSVEWRLPLATELNWDVCDHVAGIRHIYLAPFYDVGDAYLSGHELGPIAHALGAGLRVDVAWFSFIERSILSLDVAKTVNANTPFQIWISFGHPF